MEYILKVKYTGDDYYTTIKSITSRGSMEKVAQYLGENYQHMVRLGGVDRVKIVPAK